MNSPRSNQQPQPQPDEQVDVPTTTSQENDRFPVVGIGASAGGLEAFRELLSHLPIDTGMAFVFIQHLGANQKSLLSEILARETAMPVAEVKNGMRVAPNCVYVIPPNTKMTIERGLLKLTTREKIRGMVMPADTWAQAAGQRAGEVSRVIPAVSIAREAKTITASAKTIVDWQDLVNTQPNARARIALDDGSVLNLGAESSLKVVKHDAGAQQTELELAYGKLRTQAQKIGKPDGKFEVRTPAGVAGVVGTDFYVSYDNTATTMNVAVFEGSVRVCNLQGVCVIVKAGQMTNVRSGDNSGPTPPAQAPLDLLVAAGKDTDPGNPPGIGQGNGGFAGGHGALVGVLIGIPIAVITGVIIHNNKTNQPTPPNPGNGCVPAKSC